MDKKYRVLHIVALIWKILAWIVLVVSVLAGCGTIVVGLMAGTGGRGTPDALGLGGLGVVGAVASALVAIFVGVLYFLSLYAFSELVDVLLALEENTRATVEQLKTIQKT